MKKVVCVMVAFVLAASPAAAPLSAQTAVGQELAEIHLEDGRNKAEVSVIEIADHEVAVVVQLSRKSKAKIQKVELVSPSGVAYRADAVRNMPAGDVNGYLGSVIRAKQARARALEAVERLFVGEAFANCGSCGGSGASPSRRARSGSDSAVVGAFSALLNRVTVGVWCSVCLFHGLVYEDGRWRLAITYDDEGRRGALKADAELFGRMAKEQPGLEHTAGVKAGGTFAVDGETQSASREKPQEQPSPAVRPGSVLPSGSSYDPESGITTTVQGNSDGSRTIVKTDDSGVLISKETVQGQQVAP